MLPNPKILKSNRYQFACSSVIKYCKENDVIFDIGTGDGQMQEIITHQNFRWLGFDISPQNKSITKWDLGNPCPKGPESCDGVLLLEVIEHLWDLKTSLKNISRALKKNGILILSTPNPRWSKSRLHAVLTGYLSCFTQEDLDNNHHVFTPWPHIVEKALADTGFRVAEYCLIEGKTKILPRKILDISMPFKLLGNIVCRCIEKNDSTACGMSYGIIAKLI